MKPITVNVSESVYRDFQAYAKQNDRTTSELIREAMELYRNQRIRSKKSLKDFGPLSLGGVKKLWEESDDLLDELLHP